MGSIPQKCQSLALFLGALLSVLSSGVSFADEEFFGIGDLAGGSFYSLTTGVSADGSVIVGYSNSTNGFLDRYEAFRWTAGGGMVGLGDLSVSGLGYFSHDHYSIAYGVSADGSVVVGQSSSANGNEAFRWTERGGMVGLGSLSPDGIFGKIQSTARGTNINGSVIVGASNSGLSFEAFRWTEADGMVGLGDLEGGSFGSIAYGVNADGSVIVGHSSSTNGPEAFLWTEAGGMVGLGDLDGGAFSSTALAVSADGLVVVGYGESEDGSEAFRWTEAGGMNGLGDLEGGYFISQANAVNADGSAIVGQSNSANGYEAFRWLDGTGQGSGMKSVADLLTNDGIDLGGWSLYEATGISGDGKVIVGYGQNPDGEWEAWRAVIGTGLVSASGFAASLASMSGAALTAQGAVQQNLGQVMNVARHFNHRRDSDQNRDRTSSIPWSSLRFASNDPGGLSLSEAAGTNTMSLWAIGGGATSDRDTAQSDNLTGSLGISVQVTPDLRFGSGLRIGQNDFSVTGNGSESERSTYGFDGYLAIEPPNMPLRLFAGITVNSLEDDLVRGYLNGIDPVTSEGKRDGSAIGGSLVAGWTHQFAGDITLMPFAEYEVTRIRLDAYTETNGPFPATFGEIKHTTKVAKLGLEVEKSVNSTVTAWGSLAWAHQFDDKLPGISGSIGLFSSDFSYNGASMNQDWAEGRAGLSARIDERFSINASLNASFDGDENPNYGGTIGITVRL